MAKAKAAEPELTPEEKGKLESAVEDLRAHLDDPNPDHPRSGMAGVFPDWAKTIWKHRGKKILAFLEGDLGITPPPTEAEAEAEPAAAQHATPHDHGKTHTHEHGKK